MTRRSTKFAAVAAILMSTSFGPGAGSGISDQAADSTGPNSRTTAARIIDLVTINISERAEGAPADSQKRRPFIKNFHIRAPDRFAEAQHLCLRREIDAGCGAQIIDAKIDGRRHAAGLHGNGRV